VIAASFAVMTLLARCRGKRLITKLTLPHGTSPEISATDVEIMLRDYACARAMRAGGREAEHITASLPTLQRLQASGTPDVPTVCLQGGRVDRGMKKTRPMFNRTAADLMARLPQGTTIIVDGAGHLLPQENPAVVRDAVLAIFAAAGGTP
jgi:pimeloyl-ACP methyl ester carboxylesterase